jgi:hypothetical protein
VLLNHVIVVEEPLSRGADIYFVGSGIRELSVRIVEQPPRVIEADQERGVRAAAPGARETLTGGDGAGAIGEVLGAEELTADRSGEELFACVGAALEEA